LPLASHMVEPQFLLQFIRRGSDLKSYQSLDLAVWQSLLRQANRYSLVPLLYQRLVRERSGQSFLPSEIGRLLRNAYYQSLAQNTLIYHHLGQVLQRLQEAGLRLLLLKGAYLAEQVYGDIGLRPMGDLDLLSPPDEFPRTLSILTEMGFTSKRLYSEEADGVLHYHAPALSKDEIVIELHWDLVVSSGPVQIDIQRLWDRARLVTLENGHAWALAPEDLLLYLCVHAAYGHEFHGQLRSLVDIAEVVHTSARTMDWEMLLVTAREWKAVRGVYLTLALVKELLDVDLPAGLLETLRPDDWTPNALEWARQRLFRQDPELSSNFLRLMSTDLPLWPRFQALLQAIFPPRPVMTLLYGFPPGSWQITVRYLPYAASRIRLYWGHFLRRLHRDPRQELEAQSTLALQDWLGNKH
jgi:hypothetical protein